MTIIDGKLLTKEEVIKKHRQMWQTIADEIREQERCISKCEFVELHPEHKPIELCIDRCYLCEYARQKMLNTNQPANEYANRCKYCLLEWPNEEAGCNTCVTVQGDGLYDLFHDVYEDEWETAAHLAEEIANLPERHPQTETT